MLSSPYNGRVLRDVEGDVISLVWLLGHLEVNFIEVQYFNFKITKKGTKRNCNLVTKKWFNICYSPLHAHASSYIEIFFTIF